MQEDTMKDKPTRRTVDLSAYPDLVVVYLGFRVSTWRGFRELLGLGRQLDSLRRNKPDGLFQHESMLYSLRHIGIRQYWRDLESLETFTRSDPHKTWWKRFSQNSHGAGFWHEAYRKSGGMEALYLGMPKIGFAAFAEEKPAEGRFMSSRDRLAA